MTALAKIHAQSAAKMLIALVCLPVLLLWWTADASSQKAIDTERSVLTVRVYKTGLLSALGHEHENRGDRHTRGVQLAVLQCSARPYLL
jgi:hypothetical protein